jgi:tRNA nucleotidyltransferase (CCA-adding enzyme)
MEVYLVGGAVRDQLLGLQHKERDYVVVGATPELMLSQGFVQVGKDFPVFLHPKTHEEYALARTERKSGRGYGGFTVYAAPEVTLEQDLARRDLTINAIAQDEKGNLIDPFHGQRDIQEKILRHVSEAFIEDPLRVLRVARFAARFADFSIASSTQELMKQIVVQGEMEHLIADRVWVEIDKALAEQKVVRFFKVLQECGAFERLFPLFKHQADAFQKGITHLEIAANHHLEKIVRLAVFLHYFWERENFAQIEQFCDEYRIPNQYKTHFLMIERALPIYHLIHKNLSAENILSLLDATDVLRRPQQLTHFLQAVSILDHKNYSKVNQVIEKSLLAVKGLTIPELRETKLSGIEIARLVKEKRLDAIWKALG